jgi:hypothetical protein
VIALRAVERAGIWRRAGMNGAITGLAIDEARSTAMALGAPDGPVLVECLTSLEAGALAGFDKLRPPE